MLAQGINSPTFGCCGDKQFCLSKTVFPQHLLYLAFQTHTPLTQWQPLHIHHAASHVTGRVSLLEDNLAELVFDTPLWLADNDRLVLRDISARNTLAGARVVMLNPPRRGKRKPEYLQWLASLARAQSDADALSVHLERGAVNLADFAWARQLNGEGMRELLQQPGYIQAGYSLLNAPLLPDHAPTTARHQTAALLFARWPAALR